MKTCVFLIGTNCSGKTSLAKALISRLGGGKTGDKVAHGGRGRSVLLCREIQRGKPLRRRGRLERNEAPARGGRTRLDYARGHTLRGSETTQQRGEFEQRPVRCRTATCLPALCSCTGAERKAEITIGFAGLARHTERPTGLCPFVAEVAENGRYQCNAP